MTFLICKFSYCEPVFPGWFTSRSVDGRNPNNRNVWCHGAGGHQRHPGCGRDRGRVATEHGQWPNRASQVRITTFVCNQVVWMLLCST